MEKQIAVYFSNSRLAKFPADKVRFARMGSQIDETYEPDIADGYAVVNWDNVCFVRPFEKKEEED